MRLGLMGRRRDERGAIAVVVAAASVLLFVIAALAVDVGNTWARRGQLQVQADKAALFAAEFLPVDSVDHTQKSASQVKVAKAVAWYLACNSVTGQIATINPVFSRLPASCPSSPTSTALDGAAQDMLAAGKVRFPTTTQVRVDVPQARVDYAFGAVAGVSSSTQTSTATARVSSPGVVMPMGGSLGCIAAAVNSTQLLSLGDTLSSILPINYFSAGDGSNSLSGNAAGTVTWPATPAVVTSPQKLQITSAQTVGSLLTLTYSMDTGVDGLVSSVVSNLLSNLVGLGVTVYFGRSGEVITRDVPITAVGTATVELPQQVRDNPGQWEIRLAAYLPQIWQGSITGAWHLGAGYEHAMTSNTRQINAPAGSLLDLADLDNFLSCAKPIDSPRADEGGRSERMIRNIREGLDHPLTQNPSTIALAQGIDLTKSIGTLVNQALTDTSALVLSCGEQAPNVRDANASPPVRPNCVKVDTTRSWATEFTQGFLGPQGRLNCAAATGRCRDGHVFSGSEIGMAGTYNDDRVEDFIKDGAVRSTVLNDLLLQGLDTYLLPDLPLLTPRGDIDDAIYSSPRFFWAPVLTTVFTTNTDAYYPVLTFRPSFITQEQPNNTLGKKLVDLLSTEVIGELRKLIAGGVQALINGTLLSSLLSLLGLDEAVSDLLKDLGGTGKVEKHGLVLDTEADAASRLKAVRVMTLSPSAMPVVDADYDGPISEYLGSGPKVIRLVK